MDRQLNSSASKPSLSQQLLRSFRPRASTAAAPFTSSATASPISTPIDHSFIGELGTPNESTSTFNSVNILSRNGNLLERSETLSVDDFQAFIDDLSVPIQADHGSEQEENAVTDRMQKIQILILAISKKIDEEQEQDETKIVDQETMQITSSTVSSGPPQAAVIRLCLLLLASAKEGMLPLPLRLGACELTTASVKLSDIRANKVTRAVRETRSGAPGSQSSKAAGADLPLANIDRAALYDLVCHLSDGYEADLPTKDNWHQSQLPALPVQLKALEVLSYQGRDVSGFPDILGFLGQALELIWKELQILRRLQRKRGEGANDQDNLKLIEQLSAREWSMTATLQLITSIIKCGFAILEETDVKAVLDRVASMFLISDLISSASVLSHSRGRSKSREKKPLTDGYDYYGIETLSSVEQTPSASPTPRMSNTPKLGPRVSDPTSAAPIALTTLAPASAKGNSAATADHLSALQPILQTSDVRAVLVLIDTIIRFGSIPLTSIDSVSRVLCCILGYSDPLLRLQGAEERESDWAALVKPIIENLLRGHCANASLRSVRDMLKDIDRVPSHLVVVLIGAVSFLRNALYIIAQEQDSKPTDTIPLSDSALAPTLTVSLLLPALEGALQRHIDTLDLHVLRLVSDMLPLKSSTGSDELDSQRRLFASSLSDNDWDSLLDLTVVARRHVEGWKLRGNLKSILGSQKEGEQPESQTSIVVLAMLDLVSRLRLGSPNVTDDSTTAMPGKKGTSLPWTPKLAALLLSLAPMLPDHLIYELIEFYKAHDLCLPCTPDWIANIRSLLAAFFHRQQGPSLGTPGPSPVPLARRSLCALIFEHVYEVIQGLSDYRCTLMLDVVLPLAQSSLASETDAEIETTIRGVLVEGAAVAISRVSFDTSQDEHDSETVDHSSKDKDQKIFDESCELLCRLARVKPASTPAAASTNVPAKDTGNPHVSFNDPPGSHDHKATLKITARGNDITNGGTASTAAPLASPLDDRQSRSALDLIAIFHTLAFSSPWALLPLSRAKDQAMTLQKWEQCSRDACLNIFRRLLLLIKPEGDDTAAAPVRLTILQWLVRLRTDRQHRVYLAEDMDDLIGPAATSILRGVLSAQEAAAASTASTQEATRSRRGAADVANATSREGGERGAERSSSRAERSMSRVRDASRDRGRKEQSPRIGAERERSSSRSRLAGSGTTTTARRAILPEAPPLWRLPDVVRFQVPGSQLRSDVVYTYMHPDWENCSSGHHHHHHPHHSSSQGQKGLPVALPVSEYMASCIEILQNETDWDLVSYVLCHLPHQLANKHLFCGPKAQKQILCLHEMLTTSVLEQKFVNQVALPDKIKKSDVYAIAYGTLTTLISYRALFSRSQQDAMVEAFMTGLNKSSNTAQPCVRALSVACYELQKSINRYLPKMLIMLTTVMSSTVMSVHILELIAAIGHLPSLYANFTEPDYRRIFGTALQYIQYHNQDRQIREQDGQQTFNVTSFTLSQYVLMLAYYNISLWFMSLRFTDRLKHVESIRRGLLAANEGREEISDQTKVCFDFLARFTYSNANPRPRQSYLNKVIKASTTESKAKTYLFGNCLVTITSFQHFGGAELILRRSSGTLAVTCKVENAFVSRLPQEDGERLEVVAALMMERSDDTRSTLRSTIERRKEWNGLQMKLGDALRNHRVKGPPHMGIERKPKRSASFSQMEEEDGPGYRIVRKEVDAFSSLQEETLSKPTAEEDDSAISQVESLRMRESLKEVLGDARNGETAAEEENSADDDIPISSAKEFCMDPGFLALQLSSFPDLNGNAPILLPNEPATQRLIRSIDLTPVVDFHKIGVLYVGAGQMKEREILGNRSGSRNYAAFLAELGELVTLRGQQDVYTGGLDIRNDEHGKYAYVWGDDISQIVFHVTTLMPNNVANDQNHSGKKALIGNDWVRIVWNESGREYDFDTIKTQFNFINIVISPTSRGGGEVGSVNASDTIFYRVSLQSIEGLPNFSPVGDGQLISASNLANFVRIMALNSNLVSQIFVAANATESGSPYSYTSNWVSRLHHIERARAKVESGGGGGGGHSTAGVGSANSKGVDVAGTTGGAATQGSLGAASAGGAGAGAGAGVIAGVANGDADTKGASSRGESSIAYDIARF